MATEISITASTTGFLSPAEIETTRVQSTALGEASFSNVSSKQFVFFAAFDGTNNDQNNLALSGSRLRTNIAVLEEQIRLANGAPDSNVRTGYYAGVGTGGIAGGFDARSFNPTPYVIAIAESAYADFQEQASKWLKRNPGGDVTAAMSGYSRGCASGVVFSQLLNERGLTDPETGAVLVAPGQVKVNTTLLLEPVYTGIDRDMSLPANVTGNMVVVQALDEFRYMYRAADYSNDLRVHIIPFYGNHGNIGGVYDNGIGALVLQGATEFFRNAGISIAGVPQERQFVEGVPVIIYSEGTDTFNNRLWDESGVRGARLKVTIPYPKGIELSNPTVAAVESIDNSHTNPDDMTTTVTVRYLDGRVEQQLVNNAGQAILSAASGEQLTYDAQVGCYIVINPTTQETQTYDPLSGERRISMLGRATIVLDGSGALVKIIEPTDVDGTESTTIEGQSFQLLANGTAYRKFPANGYELRDAQSGNGVFLDVGGNGQLSATSAFAKVVQADGSVAQIVFAPNGQPVGVLLQHVYDDGSAINEYLYSNGRTDKVVFDLDGNISSREFGAVGRNNVETVDSYRYIDGQPVLESHKTIEYFYDDNGVSRTETVSYANGQVVKFTYDADGQLFSQENVASPTSGLVKAVSQYGSPLIDALSLVRAIQTGNPLPIATSGLRLANALDRMDGRVDLQALASVANVASGVLSILSLEQALQRGDALAAITAGANMVSFAANAYTASLTEQYGGDAIAAIAGGNAEAFQFASNIGEALPYLNVVNSLAQGDSVGAAAAVADLVLVNAGVMSVPYIGQAYAVYTIVSSLFNGDDPPEPWGSVSASWSDFNVVASAVGEHGGLESAQGAMNQFIATLNQLATHQQAASPGSPIGIVANRMPSLSYRNFTGYALTDIDAVTGVQRNPEVRYDLTGRPYNAPPGTEQSSQSLSERFVRVALARGAIAPLWEAQTAALQTQQGDPQAGLTEEERAGRNGQLAAPVTGAEQRWRPVALDLDGNGVQTTGGAKTVAFDLDDSGFLKNTTWLNGSDGFLTLDRNLNGQIDSGRELFSNALLALGARGLGGLRWIDANYDGRLDASDPVWSELRVWRDANGDGVEGTGEKVRLSALGITSLNYTMGTFQQDGQLRQLASPDLAADTSGARTHVVPEGIVIETTEGRISLLVTRVDDHGDIEANRDGVTIYEDTETIISTADLVANDTLGGTPGQGLAVTSVGDFTHGTGYLDGNGFIHYMPEANYYGTAGFTYTVQDSTGQSGTATVDLNIQNVNDAPTATIDQHMRPIYGYQSVEYDESGNAVYVAPAYEPYTGWDYLTSVSGLHDTPITYEDSDGPNNATIIVSDIDDPSGQFAFDVLQQAQKGEARVYSDGRVEYINWTSPDTPGTDLDESGGPIEADPFTVRVTDPHGASTTVIVDSQHAGGYNPDVGSGGGGKPVSIDLDGNGFRFTNVDDSNVFFDINGDGWKNRISWPSSGDGLLARDIDGDGKIDQSNEISFTAYSPGAQTDLDALRVFDTNADGLLSVADAKWSQFGIWRDANQNGITDEGEFRMLDDMGVASVSLASDGQFSVIDGQTVHGLGAVTMVDGSTRQLADVTLAYNNDVLVPGPDGTSAVVRKAAFSHPGEVLEGAGENDLILGKTADNVVYAREGDDVVFEDGGNDAIDAGPGNDVIYSGADNDVVIGGEGDDVVFSGRGNDLMLGGDGHDALFGEGGNDIGFGGDGNDLVYGDGGNDVLSGDRGDDEVYGGTGSDALFGGAGDDVLAGMEGYDLLYGGSGNDLLDGGAEKDTMYGGAGNDTYVVDSASDLISEEQNEGEDTVRAGLSYVLGDNLENLTLTGSENISGSGNALDNVLTGNSGDNALDGEAGNDVLNGGAGADLMAGGAGDDIYVVDNVGDVVREYADEGNDTVRASRSYSLAGNVENLILTGFASIDGIGNTLDNELSGNSADNVLDGGSGADTMGGGRGNDTYVVDNACDTVTETSDGGLDTVRTALSHTLEANVEALVLTGYAAVEGTGNELDNLLTGNGASNVLDGGGGVDRMAGGGGDDTYVVDDAADVVVERPDEGIDTVIASVGHRLADNVEALRLVGTAGIDGIGNGLNNVIIGNAGSNVLDGAAGADTLAGGAGDDTYRVDDAGDVVIENYGEGNDVVISGIDYALRANVEALVLADMAVMGTGNDLANTLTANDLGNRLFGQDGNDDLRGGAGNDTLDGGVGADRMTGHAGDDIYVVDDMGDVVIEQAGEGDDRVRSAINYTLTEHVENLDLTGTENHSGTGNALDNAIAGNVGDNALYGREGRDVLSGGEGNDLLDGGMGVDVLKGGAGDDVYIVDDSADAVGEFFAEGRDYVYASVSYVLPEHVESLALTTGENIDATGNELGNMLTGNAGHNVLDGAEGADTMIGGTGNDTYLVDDAADVVVEDRDAGVDAVFSSVTYALSNNVEMLTLAGAADIDGIGNALDNMLTGNGGNNTLDGGAGVDAMAGGKGNDTYQVDNSGDSVTEGSNEGHDTIVSQVSYVLPEWVEDLRLEGASDIYGVGNAVDNTLYGNIGDNVLNGAAGKDTMLGGAGDDQYLVDEAADSIVEAADQGHDTVLSTASYVLSDNVEDLQLENGDDIDGTGNAMDNVIDGNAGANRLNGLGGDDTLTGGLGNDVLDGGAGNDVYVYNIGDGLDTITDLSGTDSVRFGAGLDLANVALRIWSDNGVNVAQVHILDACGCEQADQGFDFAMYADASGAVASPIERFVFADGAVRTWQDLLIKQVTTTGNSRTLSIATDRNDDTIIGGPRAETISSGTGNDIVYGGSGADTVYGEGGDDYLLGGTVSDTLDGGCGVNVLDGRQGDDMLVVADDGSALLGASGSDFLRSAAGADFLAGGKQDDTVDAGAGSNVIAFNASDGRDVILPSVGARNTLSLGANVDTGKLYFRKLNADLRLEVNDDSSVTFRDWYSDAGNQTLDTLQIFNSTQGGHQSPVMPRVDAYDFRLLVAKFDEAQAVNPTSDRWSVMSGMLESHLSSSDSAALGGDLAAAYAERGDLAGMNLSAAQDVLTSPRFGTEAQTLRSWQQINNETMRLL